MFDQVQIAYNFIFTIFEYLFDFVLNKMLLGSSISVGFILISIMIMSILIHSLLNVVKGSPAYSKPHDSIITTDVLRKDKDGSLIRVHRERA